MFFYKDNILHVKVGKEEINLLKLIKSYNLPLLVRIPILIEENVKRLYNTFNKEIEKSKLKVKYNLFYPLKVNQRKEVVKAITKKKDVGLESGSKGEMIIAMKSKAKKIIANGFFDENYLELAKIASKNKEVIVNFNNIADIPLFFKVFDKEDEVKIGLRLRFESKLKGKWSKSTGIKSKFGLSFKEIVKAVKLLKKEGFINKVKMIHFHPGSQLLNFDKLANILKEVSKVVRLIEKENGKIEAVNVGGGLPVDYTLRKDKVKEYAKIIVASIKKFLRNKVNYIYSESGRYNVASHLFLITNKKSKVSCKGIYNFSLFNVAVDHWAINQLFPVFALEKGKEKFKVADITCDSDGEFKFYQNGSFVKGKSNIICIALLGAYQEVLATNHNLFGKPNEVIITFKNGKIKEKFIKGESVNDIIKKFGYNIKDKKLSRYLQDQTYLNL